MFVVYVTIQKQKEILVHSKKQAQIKALLFNGAFTEVLIEYSDYNNVFLVKNIVELLENTRIN